MERRTLLLVLALLSIVAFSSGALPPLPELQTREELRQFIAESNQGARLLFVTTDNRDCVLCPAQEKALRTTAGIEGANFKIAKLFMTDDRLRILREEGQIDRTGGIFFEAENQLKIPALIYFRDGIPRRYEVPFDNLQRMVNFFQLYTEHAVFQIDTEEEWKKWSSAERVFKVTALLREQKDFDELESAARVMQTDMMFAVLANRTIAEREGFFSSEPHIYITSPYSTRRHVLDLSGGVERLKLTRRLHSFLKNSVLPLGPSWTPEAWSDKNPLPMLLTFLDQPATNTAAAEEAYKALLLARETNKHREEYWSFVVDAQEYETMAKSAGVNLDDLPHVQLLHPEKNKRFYYRGALGGASISEFVDKYFEHKLRPDEKSAEPSDDDGTDAMVQMVVFKQYKSKVEQEAKRDVVVEFWKPDCLPCLDFNPRFEKLAENYEGDSNIVFYKYNTLENDIPDGVDVDKLPSIAIYRAPVDAEDEEELQEMLEERDPVLFSGLGEGLQKASLDTLIHYVDARRATKPSSGSAASRKTGKDEL